MIAAALLALLVTMDVPSKDHGVDALAVPLLSFNSDQGVGYGVAGGSLFYEPGYRPYRLALSAQTFFTRKGVQSHYFHFDAPALIGPLRLEGQVEYKRELFAPFFGPGNLSAPGVVGDEIDRVYAFDRSAPAAWARTRWRVLGPDHPFEVSAGYLYRFNRITPYAGSLLEALAPHGMQGGHQAELLLGVSWDTRDHETDTNRGGLTELSLRTAGAATGSAQAFTGLTVSVRRFVQLNPRFVLGQRLVADALFGDVPFFEWTAIGGASPLDSVGGMGSVRGLPRERYGGNFKALSNTELRWDAWVFNLLGQQSSVGAVALFDVGRVWHPGVDNGPWYRWHPGVGGGLRLARRAAVARIDYALSTETRRQGLYVTFGQMF